MHGSRWDAINHSCAYDALLTLVYNTSRLYPKMWSALQRENEMLRYFFICLDAHSAVMSQSTRSALEMTREDLRNMISLRHPDLFHRHGSKPTDIVSLVGKMGCMTGPTGIFRVYACSLCGWSNGEYEPVDSIVLHAPLFQSEYTAANCSSTDMLFNALAPAVDAWCPYCRIRLKGAIELAQEPGVLLLVVPTVHSARVKIDLDAYLTMSGQRHEWSLQGAIYQGNSHFTCQIIDAAGDVWYHDGIETGSHCAWRGNKQSLNSKGDINSVRNRNVCVLVYRHVT